MKKLMTTCLIIGIFLSGIPVITSHAVECDEQCTEIIDEPSEGLLIAWDISGSNYSGSLCVNASISSYTNMEIIGFKDVKVQYSYNGSQWYNEWNAGDFLTYNNDGYDLSNYIIALDRNGCYYRVECKCYAKKSLLNTQSVTIISNSVWIS